LEPAVAFGRVRRPGFDILDQLLKCLPTIDTQTTLACIRIGLDDFDAAPGRLFTNLVGLILRRILLVLGRHPHVLSGPE